MPRMRPVLLRSGKFVDDLKLLKTLRSEIRHEHSSNRFQNKERGLLGDFVLDWDSPKSEDVLLRRKYGMDEEVTISALLAQLSNTNKGMYPRDVLMKVCVTKPRMSSLLFECGISSESDSAIDFHVHNARYLHSLASLGPSFYKGPLSSRRLEPKIRDAMKEYLGARGISESLNTFLLHHLHQKEQAQYVKWLHHLESMVYNGVMKIPETPKQIRGS